MSVSSWNVRRGCGYLFILVLLAVLLGEVRHIDSVEIDLIEDLNHLPSSRHSIQHSTEWSLNLTDRTDGNNFLSQFTTERILKILSHNKGFSLCVSLKQNLTNSGTIFSIIYQGKLRFLEIRVSIKRKVVRVLYFPDWMNYGIRSEKLYFNTTKSPWKLLCIEYSNNTKELTLYLECKEVSKLKLIKNIPLQNFDKKNKNEYKVWIGQRGSRTGLFKGWLKKMIFSDNTKYSKKYCSPISESTHQFSSVSNIQSDPVLDRMTSMEMELADLKQQFADSQKYLNDIKQCQCFPQCVGTNGEKKTFGDTWMDTACSNCTCTLQGKVCHQETCAALPCAGNITDQGKCCPRCLYNCQYQRKQYPHNQTFSIGCMDCICKDGTLSCRRINPDVQCPKLKCHKFLQVKVKGQCCKTCKVLNLCELAKCGPNARCLESSSVIGCQCIKGYDGNPYTGCVDINECDTLDKCSSNSECINTDGSYSCECKAGFVKANISSNICKATCIKHPCLNNSTCIGPERCECKAGFTGSSCDTDIDECRLGLVKCPLNSQCVNIPGGYICQCVLGYRSLDNDSMSISYDHHCADINECQGTKGMDHQCDTSSSCENIPGGHRCIPRLEKSQPFGSNCAIQRRNGDITLLYDKSSVNLVESCKTCRCQDGALTCDGVKCDCSVKSLASCCPKCSESNCSGENELSFGQANQIGLNCSLARTSCTSAVCPLITCKDSIDLPGQCCKYCQADGVTWCITVYNNISPIVSGLIQYMTKCNIDGKEYNSGKKIIRQQFNDGSCLTCLCWNGHLCCGKSFLCTDL